MESKQSPSRKKPYINEKNAKELGSKGGKNTTDKKKLSNSMNSRKYCKPDCPMYPCPLQPATKKPEFKGLCALKEAPQDVQALMTNLFLKGREGAIREYTNNICEMALMAKRARGMNQKAVFSIQMKGFVETAYGKIMNVKQDIKAEIKGELVVNDFKKAMKEMKE